MTETARVYGGSLYELAQEEHLEEEILSEMKEIRALFRENPKYPRLLSEPSIPRKERIGLIDAAFGSQAEPYLVNFIKLLCEKNLLREFGGCQEAFQRRYFAAHNIAEAVVTSAASLSKEQEELLKKKTGNDERKNGRDGTENRSVRSGGCPRGARRKAV